ncbi:MAG: hypothetical protein WCL34_04345 [Methylococcaceae bacterium]
MFSFICSNIQAVINSIGLLFDIAGAIFVSWEVVRQFEGNKIHVRGGTLRTDYLGSDGTPVVAGQFTEETEEFKFWETKKYNRMKWGLGFLTIGFLLQLASNWILKFVSC